MFGVDSIAFAPDTLATGAWNAVEIVNIPGADDPSLTADLLEMYVNLNSSGDDDLYVATRGAVGDTWSLPRRVDELSTTASNESTPEVALDGLSITFTRHLATVSGEILMATRATRDSVWREAAPIAELNTPFTESAASASRDQLTLVLSSNRAVGFDLYLTQRSTTSDPWDPPVRIDNLSTTFDDTGSFLSADGLVVYFASNRGGGFDLYMASRPSRTAAFEAATPISELNSETHESDPWVSPDGHHAFLTSERFGAPAIYYSTR